MDRNGGAKLEEFTFLKHEASPENVAESLKDQVTDPRTAGYLTSEKGKSYYLSLLDTVFLEPKHQKGRKDPPRPLPLGGLHSIGL